MPKILKNPLQDGSCRYFKTCRSFLSEQIIHLNIKLSLAITNLDDQPKPLSEVSLSVLI